MAGEANTNSWVVSNSKDVELWMKGFTMTYQNVNIGDRPGARERERAKQARTLARQKKYDRQKLASKGTRKMPKRPYLNNREDFDLDSIEEESSQVEYEEYSEDEQCETTSDINDINEDQALKLALALSLGLQVHGEEENEAQTEETNARLEEEEEEETFEEYSFLDGASEYMDNWTVVDGEEEDENTSQSWYREPMSYLDAAAIEPSPGMKPTRQNQKTFNHARNGSNRTRKDPEQSATDQVGRDNWMEKKDWSKLEFKKSKPARRVLRKNGGLV